MLLHGFEENKVRLSWLTVYLFECISAFLVFIIEPARKYSFNTGSLEPKESDHCLPAMPRLHPQSVLLCVCVSIS